MNNRKTKNTANNENLCPVSGKRLKQSSTRVPSNANTKNLTNTSLKLIKSNIASSAPGLVNEYLEEMGVGVLESEESSSSAASALALSTSSDENSNENTNEATPNLDAPKLNHQSIAKAYQPIDYNLDLSTDNANTGLNFTNNTSKTSDNIGAIANEHRCNINNNNSNNSKNSNDGTQESQEQKVHRPNDKPHKKVAILGAGAGIMLTSGKDSNSNSPSAGCSTRSPLATVDCNSQHRNAEEPHQAIINISNTYNFMSGTVGGTMPSQNLQQRTQSPSLLPSTSGQAATKLQRQQLQLLQSQLYNKNFLLYRNSTYCDNMLGNSVSTGKTPFDLLSDEMVLQIFKWLPKKALLRCGSVCRRFYYCARDESLWARLDLGGRYLRSGALEHILTRGVIVLRMAQAILNDPVFHESFLSVNTNFEARLQYLDLSMVTISKPSLKMLLSCCHQLKKLSLENATVNDEICNEIAKNSNLEALNLAMVVGLEAWSVSKLMASLKNLNSLNISWTNLSVEAISSLVSNVTENIIRLNIAGCRKTMFSSHLYTLSMRCTQLLELDLSDCTGLTSDAAAIISNFRMLEYLSISRCYQLAPTHYDVLRNITTLTYLDVFGMVTESSLAALQRSFPKLCINKFTHSSVARPTVGTRRTSIWGLRTRD